MEIIDTIAVWILVNSDMQTVKFICFGIPFAIIGTGIGLWILDGDK